LPADGHFAFAIREESHNGGYLLKILNAALFCAFVATPLSASAQSVVAPLPAAGQTVIIGGPVQNTLRTGTQINLTLMEPLSTEGKKLRVGYRFQLEVAEPVMVNGQIVVPVGSPALGEITEVRNKGMWGKSGHLTASVLYVTVGGRQIRLNGTFDDKGVTGTGGVVAAAVFIPVVGFFTTGTSARVPLNAPVRAFIGEDVPLAFVASAPAPMAVPVAPVSAVPISTPVRTGTATPVTLNK
jgi:hypothetical protein